ncbi:outer membrane beta-barrel protein [Candidatus Thiodictyon syntrophicum]|uniref:Outer membrane beta-barrel protein n=1 Tax=Candidatus Thiodictyon syntrophicum TaxID=1166950 RepID=A0A2K8UE83_9GAMM|nr:outer membrane beta-barrel protein [Candidatus Thiodictyon syntrophicum]AUB83749.1 hypothetical protein THSYN_24195 [Candidatus Thiodictyon syntrophicum]
MVRLRPFMLVGVLAICAVPGTTLGQPVGTGFDLGGFRAYPWLNLLAGYESNYYKTSNDVRLDNAIAGLGGVGRLSTWETVVEPGIRLTALKGADSYSLSYFARIGIVSASPADNFTDQQAQANANWEFGLRHRVTFNYQYWYWHDRRGSGSPVDSSRANFFYPHPDLWDSNRVTLGYSYGAPGARGRLDLMAGYRTRHYLNNNQEVRDNDRPVLGATLYTRVSPKVSLLFDAAWEKVNYTRQAPGALTLDSDQMTLYTGVTWDATAKTSGTVKVGWLGKNFAAGQRENVSDFGWSAQLQYRPRTYSTFNLVTERTPAETNTGLADAIVVSLVNLDWVYYWQPRLYTRVGLLGTNDKYIGEARTDHRYNASGGVFYQMRRWLELGVNYTYEARTSDVPLDAADYTDNVLLFSMRTAY